MEEIEITLDSRTAAWVEASAAERNQTVSEFVADLLQNLRRESREQASGMQRDAD